MTCFICGGDGNVPNVDGASVVTCSNCNGTGSTLADTRRQPKPRKFYLVWRADGSVPRKPHKHYSEALAEAKRLAIKHPGAEFHVVVAIAEIVRDDVHVTYL